MRSFLDFVDNHFVRIIGTIALLVTYESMYLNKGLLAVCIAMITLAIYLAITWCPRHWWNRTFYVTVTAFVLGTGCLLHFSQHVSVAGLFWPLVCVLALMPQTWRALSMLLASVVVTCTVLLAYSYPFSLGMLLGLVGTYMSLRSRAIRAEAYALSQSHLEELEEAHRQLQHAHEELQTVTVDSMRYAALAERSRIAREVHDVLGHNLTSLIVQLQALEMMLPHDVNRAAKTVPDLLQIARAGMSEVRQAIREWAGDETELGSTALRGLVSQMEATSGIETEFIQQGPTSDWPLETGTTLYRILQETLTNTLRHAQATHLTVTLQEQDGHVTLDVSDNGTCVDAECIAPGFGIEGMKARCRGVGGHLHLFINEPHGLHIRAVIPVQSDAETRTVISGGSHSSE